MLKFSTGLLDAMMGDVGFRGAMEGGVVRIFNGQRPESANDAIPGGNTEIARITTEGKIFYPGADTEGAGLKFLLYSGGILRSDGIWILTGRASGVPVWFRWNWGGVDDNADSETMPRIDGDVGDVEVADLTLDIYSIFPSTRRRLEVFEAVFPS